ncbi:hypothetical protein [Bacillus altitudinis]|uniref:hypothetical protein n=1 Tax=Bacillus altitudinis TaxID=293387 RepID=UPI00119D0585|nr:hypothetical protein [Bacillus altitudinis]
MDWKVRINGKMALIIGGGGMGGRMGVKRGEIKWKRFEMRFCFDGCCEWVEFRCVDKGESGIIG